MRSTEPSRADLGEVVARAREEIQELSETAAELRATVPAQVSAGIREAIEAEVLPVARHIAEVRGLSSQLVRRLERTQSAIASEREARIDDLDVLVDLLVSSWQGLDARLARIEASLDAGAAPEPQEAPERVPASDAAESDASGDTTLSAVSERQPRTSALG